MGLKIQNSVDEKKLWRAVQEGDDAAFRLLYMEYSDILYNYGYKICQNDTLIKDSIQNVFQILWEKRSKIELKSSLKYYMLTIFRRDLISKIRAQQKSVKHFPEIDFELSIESKIILDESQQQLRREMNQAINTLTPRQKEILFLRYYENMSYEEISELMSLNQNSMYKLLSAAIKRLKKHFSYLLLSFLWGIFYA